MNRGGKWTKAGSFLLAAMLLLLLNHYFGLSERVMAAESLESIRNYALLHPFRALLLYIGLTILGCVFLAVPGVSFALLAGLLFGPVLGSLACLLATTLGAMGAFLAARFFLKDAVKPMLEKNRLLKLLLFSEKQENELLLLMITRMVPIFPYNLQNFAYGVTDISFWKYSVCTFLFMLPGVSFFTIGAAGLTKGAEAWRYYLFAGLLALMVTLLGLWLKQHYLKGLTEEEA